jgi:hypothetical protein
VSTSPRDRAQEAEIVLDGVARGGHAGFDQARRDQPGLGGASDLQRLGHRSEIADDAAGERSRHGERLAACAGSSRNEAEAAAAASVPKIEVGCQPLWWDPDRGGRVGPRLVAAT